MYTMAPAFYFPGMVAQKTGAAEALAYEHASIVGHAYARSSAKNQRVDTSSGVQTRRPFTGSVSSWL